MPAKSRTSRKAPTSQKITPPPATQEVIEETSDQAPTASTEEPSPTTGESQTPVPVPVSSAISEGSKEPSGTTPLSLVPDIPVSNIPNDKPDIPVSRINVKGLQTTEDATPTAYNPPTGYMLYEGRRVQVIARYDKYVQIQDGGSTKHVDSGSLAYPTADNPGVGGASKLNINQALVDDLVDFKVLEIPSASVARQLLRNRQNGYRDFEHFRQVNSHISSVNWEILRMYLTF